VRRTTLGIALAFVVVLVPAGRADAAGLWLSTDDISPDELRIAIAASPERTTVWTSLVFDSRPTTVALVLPAPPGSMVDVSPDSWFDALDLATAPRIYPAPGLVCPDGSPPFGADPPCAATAAGYFGQAGIPATSFDVLASPDAVRGWAGQHGMAIPDDVSAAFDAFPATPFVAVRFVVPPPGAGATQTVRMVMPGAPPRLVLSLFDPGDRSPNVTTYLIGRGRGTLGGASSFVFDGSSLEPTACSADLYAATLSELLLRAGSAVVQYAGHDVWTTPVNSDPGAEFDSVVHGYFAGAPTRDTPLYTCVGRANAVLGDTGVVGNVCPAGAAAIVDGGAPCMPGGRRAQEPLQGASVDPSMLPCGAADDLAIAFSGLQPREVWITRQTLALGAPSPQDYDVVFEGGYAVSPVVLASEVTPDLCATGMGGTGGGGGTGGSSDAGSSANSKGCDGGDAAGATLEGCGAVADGLSGIGDAAGDCSASGFHPRPSAWTMALALFVLPLRRMGRRPSPSDGRQRETGRAVPSPRA
jgi:hypothetical protein